MIVRGRNRKKKELLSVVFVATLWMTLSVSCSTISCGSEKDVVKEDLTTDTSQNSETEETDNISSSDSPDSQSESAKETDDRETQSETVATSEENDSDTETESEVEEVSITTPIQWEQLAEGEECGEGCREMSFVKRLWETKGYDVSKRWVAYTSEEQDIYIVDLEKELMAKLPELKEEYCEDERADCPSKVYPAIYESVLVYSSFLHKKGGGVSRLVVVDLAEETQTIIKEWGMVKGVEYLPGVGEKDVYKSYIFGRGGCGKMDANQVCLFDMENANRVEVIKDDIVGGHVGMWENYLVWGEALEKSSSILLHELETGKTVTFTEDKRSQLFPRINKGKVAFMDLSLGDSGVYGDMNHAAVIVKDVKTGIETQVTDGTAIAAEPDIYGDVVVWEDFRDCKQPNNIADISNVEIWGHNLRTGETAQITGLPGRAKTSPRIYGDRVFFQMHRKAQYEDSLYMIDLPESLKTPEKK